MRKYIELQTDWCVSVSEGDAVLAASNPDFSAAELELAEDALNLPRCIDLPRGPEYGKRPIQDDDGTQSTIGQ